MPSSDIAMQLRDRLWTHRNLTITTAIIVGLFITYVFGVTFDPEGSFLLLLTVGVVVPTLYDEYWPPYGQAWKAVGWIVGASVAASGVFVGLYWVGSSLFGLSSLLASTGSFLLTTGSGIVLLAR